MEGKKKKKNNDKTTPIPHGHPALLLGHELGGESLTGRSSQGQSLGHRQ
jgi:hypothetical protein